MRSQHARIFTRYHAAAAKTKLVFATPEGSLSAADRISSYLSEIKAEILRSTSTSKEFEFPITDIEAAEKEIERHRKTVQQPSD